MIWGESISSGLLQVEGHAARPPIYIDIVTTKVSKTLDEI